MLLIMSFLAHAPARNGTGKHFRSVYTLWFTVIHRTIGLGRHVVSMRIIDAIATFIAGAGKAQMQKTLGSEGLPVPRLAVGI